MARFAIAFITFFASLLAVIAAPLSSRASFSGTATFFAVGLGACGNTNVDTDYIVALPAADYDNGAHCGKKIEISYGGTTKTATVEDLCPGCSSGDLDMSPSLFEQFASQDKGVFEMTWKFA